MLILTHLASLGSAGAGKTKPDLSTLTGAYRSDGPDPAAAQHTVQFLQGRVFVDGRSIAKPEFRSGVVRWSEKTSGLVTTGCLVAMAGGARLSGVISSGPDEASAKTEFVTLALADLTFATQVLRTDRPGQIHVWEDGPPLQVGVRFQNGLPAVIAQIDGVDVQVASLPPPDGSYDARLDVAITFGQDWPGGPLGGVAFALPVRSDILIAADGASFTGKMSATSDGAPFPWRGAAPAAPPAPLALAPEAVSTPDLGLPDLMSLTTTGATNIARAYFNSFTVLGMQDTWRDSIFGLTPPALPADVQSIYTANASLFTDHASDAIILHQLAALPSDQGGPSTPISASDKLKLDYFYTRGIMGVDGYTQVSAYLTQAGWEQATPRIRDYVNDRSQSWAKLLYDALTTPAALTTAVMAYIGSGGDLTQVNHHADMLLALSPSADQSFPLQDGQAKPIPATYASLYHSKVLSALGVTASQQVSFPQSTDDQQALADYVSQWLTSLMTSLATELQDKSLPQATQAMYQEIEIELTSINQAQDGLSNLSNEIVTAISEQVGPASSPNNFLGKVQAWAAGSKLGKGLVKAIQTAAIGYTLYSVIGAFSGWSTLSDKQKAQTVIDAAGLPIDMLGMIADADLPQVFPKLFAYFGSEPTVIDTVEQALAANQAEDEWFFNTDLRWIAPALEDESAEAAITFVGLFGKDSSFMKAFGVLVAAATVGFSSFQIYEDRNSSAAIKAIDSLQLISNVAILVGAMVAEDSLLAALGPIGIVAGVILAIIALFIGKPKPDKPADDYMDQRGNAYLSNLPPPDSNWTDPMPSTGGAA